MAALPSLFLGGINESYYCRKAKLGRTIASALGVYDKYDGYLSSGEIAVTYAFGHFDVSI